MKYITSLLAGLTATTAAVIPSNMTIPHPLINHHPTGLQELQAASRTSSIMAISTVQEIASPTNLPSTETQALIKLCCTTTAPDVPECVDFDDSLCAEPGLPHDGNVKEEPTTTPNDEILLENCCVSWRKYLFIPPNVPGFNHDDEEGLCPEDFDFNLCHDYLASKRSSADEEPTPILPAAIAPDDVYTVRSSADGDPELTPAEEEMGCSASCGGAACSVTCPLFPNKRSEEPTSTTSTVMICPDRSADFITHVEKDMGCSESCMGPECMGLFCCIVTCPVSECIDVPTFTDENEIERAIVVLDLNNTAIPEHSISHDKHDSDDHDDNDMLFDLFVKPFLGGSAEGDADVPQGLTKEEMVDGFMAAMAREQNLKLNHRKRSDDPEDKELMILAFATAVKGLDSSTSIVAPYQHTVEEEEEDEDTSLVKRVDCSEAISPWDIITVIPAYWKGIKCAKQWQKEHPHDGDNDAVEKRGGEEGHESDWTEVGFGPRAVAFRA